MSKTRLVIILVAICLVDTVIPLPILGFVLLHVIFVRPLWFRQLVDGIYNA